MSKPVAENANLSVISSHRYLTLNDGNLANFEEGFRLQDCIESRTKDLFSNWAEGKMIRFFLIIFSDETHFLLNRYVNKQ